MSLLKRESRTWSGGGGYWGPYADGTIPPPWWQGPGVGNSSGITINQESAVRISAVWACVQLVCDYIAGLPVSVLTPRANGEVTKQGVPPLLAQPFAEMTQYEWFFAMQSSLMLRGNAYGRKIGMDDHGYPQQIQPQSADNVTVQRRDGALQYKFGNVIVPTHEVFHLRAFVVPGKDTGISPIEAFANTLGIAIAAEDFGARWFGDGAHPTAVLQSDQKIDGNQAATILARIREKFAGGNREPIVLGAGAKWVPIQVTANESQFLDTLKFGVNQIARIFGLGVCPELIGGTADGSNITYANAESRSIDLQTYGILPWTVRWEQALTPLMPYSKSYVSFDLDARLRVDMKTRYESHVLAVRGGWHSADDVRRVEGEAPLPGGIGEQYLWPPYAAKIDAEEDNASVDETDPAAQPSTDPAATDDDTKGA